MSAGRALFAAPGALRALVPGCTGTVALKPHAAAYLELDSGWLMLTGPRAQFGPLTLVLDGVDVRELALAWPVRLETERLTLGPLEVSLERMRERLSVRVAGGGGGVPADVGSSAVWPGAVAAAAGAARAALPALPDYLDGGITALERGDLRDAVASLAGRGEGLTPAGDDVLAGFAAARSACGRPAGSPASLVRLASGRASPLGLAYLACAEHGELPDVDAALLRAVCSGRARAVTAALPALRKWGASSGVAIAWGIVAALGGSF